MRLLRVPRAAARRTQPVHDGDDVEQARAGDVEGADEQLDVGRLGQARHLDGDGVAEAGVAVGRADPHDVADLGGRHEVAREVGRVGGLAGQHLDAGLDQRCDLRLVGTSPHGIRLLEARPRFAGEEPRRDAGCRDEQDDAGSHGGEGGTGYCAADGVAGAGLVSGLTQLGVC